MVAVVLGIIAIAYVANNFATNIASGANQAESSVGVGVAVGVGGALLLLPLLLL